MGRVVRVSVNMRLIVNVSVLGGFGMSMSAIVSLCMSVNGNICECATVLFA